MPTQIKKVYQNNYVVDINLATAKQLTSVSKKINLKEDSLI